MGPEQWPAKSADKKPEEKKGAKIYPFPAKEEQESESARDARWAIENKYDRAKKIWREGLDDSFSKGDIRDFFQHFDDVLREKDENGHSDTSDKIKAWLTNLTNTLMTVPEDLTITRDNIALQALKYYALGVKAEVDWLRKKTNNPFAENKNVVWNSVFEEVKDRINKMREAREKKDDNSLLHQKDPESSHFLADIWTFLRHQEMNLDREENPSDYVTDFTPKETSRDKEIDRRIAERITKAL